MPQKAISLMHVYHGTTTPDISELEQRTRYTPAILSDRTQAAIYAGDDPAYAAGHAIPWSSEEGFDLDYEGEKVVLSVPDRFRDRVNQEIYIYILPGDSFELLESVKPEGHNFRSLHRVRPLGILFFGTVQEAMNYFGGEIRFIKSAPT